MDDEAWPPGSTKVNGRLTDEDVTETGIVGATSNAGLRLGEASTRWGHNTHYSSTVIRQEVELGSFAELTSASLGPDFAERFAKRFDGLRINNSGDRLPNDFLEKLRTADGVPFVELLLRAIICVEAAVASRMHHFDPVDFAEILRSPSGDRAILVWSCHLQAASKRVAPVAFVGLLELLPEAMRPRKSTQSTTFEAKLQSLFKYARRRRRLRVNRGLMVQAAIRNGVPWDLSGDNLLSFGEGRFRHNFWGGIVSNESFAACRLARDKSATSRLLEKIDLPIPEQATATDPDGAQEAAERIGYPVVVKPLDGHGGNGVSADLRGPAEVAAAFERARPHASSVLVEAFVGGEDHRLMVIGGRFVAASKKTPPFVSGDGKRTILELVDELNGDPRRNGLVMVKVSVDGELIRLVERAGFTVESVLPKGRTLALRSTANMSTGGSSTDVTDHVHPDNREMAVRAARAVGLEVAGIDYLTTDISRSYREVGGGIIEVNASPGLDLHDLPTYGVRRETARTVLELMFPPGFEGRVPVALVVATRGYRTLSVALGAMLRANGESVGLVDRRGPFVNGSPVGPLDGKSRKAIRTVLQDPLVGAMVRIVSHDRIARRGLCLDWCQAAAILDLPDYADLDEVREGLSVAVRATRGKLVVAARNAAAMGAVRWIEPSRIILVAVKPGARVRSHLVAGGWAAIVALDRGRPVIALMEGRRTVLSLPIDDVPAPTGAASRSRVEALLFAVALAHAMGRSEGEIVSVLRSNLSDGEQSADRVAPDPERKDAERAGSGAPIPAKGDDGADGNAGACGEKWHSVPFDRKRRATGGGAKPGARPSAK